MISTLLLLLIGLFSLLIVGQIDARKKLTTWQPPSGTKVNRLALFVIGSSSYFIATINLEMYIIVVLEALKALPKDFFENFLHSKDDIFNQNLALLLFVFGIIGTALLVKATLGRAHKNYIGYLDRQKSKD